MEATRLRDQAEHATASVRPMFDHLSPRGIGTLNRDVLAVNIGLAVDCRFIPVFGATYGELPISEWEYPFDEISLGKGDISAETGLSSREVQLLHPLLIKAKYTLYWGSVIRDGVIVTCSGVQPWFDEFFATSILALVSATTDDDLRRLVQNNSTNTYDRSW